MNMKHFFAPSAWRLGGAVRRAATMLLLCVMTMTVQTAWAQSGNWSDNKAAAFSTINESAKTISITSEAELALLAYNTCNGTDYSGYTITLTKDLNMRAHYWDKSIGTELSYYSGNNSFRGTFNGANKTISGIYISSGSFKGLFGFVGMNEKPGTIQNVTLASSTITGDDNVGGIVGCLLYGTVSNCHVLSSVSILASGDGSNNHGGIVGQTYPNKKVSSATIENCTSAASVTNNGHNNCSSYGGIVGYNYYYSDQYFSKVTGCFYYGTAVSASSEVGAIVGLNYKEDGTGISNCYYNYPSTISGIGYDNKDIGTTRVYTVTCTTSGLSTTGTATYTHNGTHYFAAGATATVTLGAADKAITSLNATSGTISNVSIAPDGQSATFTVGSSDVTDVTVSATLKALSGTTEDGLTWSLGGTNYTELTIGGNGAMQNFDKNTTGNIWKTKAPWGTDITSVTIGDGVTSIGNYAFCGCQSLASVTLGSGVTSIGYAAINHCDAMTEITLPAATTTIGTGAFANSTGLQRVNIGHDGAVTLADNGTFSGCNALQYIVFPSPAGALANTTGNWSGLTDKLRAQFGSQLFTVTTEGGTAAYAITNEQDLRNLATAVNAGNYADSKTFRQTLDITMSSTNFTPIGNTYYFNGTYDGGGKAIIGLHINSNQAGVGMFRNVEYGGKVKNLYLDTPNVNSSDNGQSVIVSAVVGYLSDASTIENCYVINPTLTISTNGEKYYVVIVGNIGDAENRISNCYFYDSNADHNYNTILRNNASTITNVGRAYTIAATSPVTASATKAFTYDGTDYYVEGSTVTLSGGTPHANGGWVDTYTVDGTAIAGNTFSLTADATVGYSSTPDATHFAETADTEYTIYDATGWGVFCDLLAENNQGFFTGKTVVLDKDIAVTRMAGSTNHEFSGTFDGQKHTLTVAITGTVQGTAPFCEIKGATIRNLAVTGSVAGMRHSAGLVGFARGDNSVTNIIENCLVNTSVSITGDTNGYLGGIVGHGLTSALTIRGCAFTGSLTSTSNYTGGLQGWSDGNILTLQNDLFAPTSVSAANDGFHPVAFHNNNSTTTATVSNVYYTVAPTCTQATRIATANAAEQPKQARSITAGQWVTVSHAGVANTYSASGITAYKATGASADSDPFIAGLLYNNNVVDVLYAGSDEVVSLTLSNTATGAPDGYQYGYTTNAGTLEGSTLTMPDQDVTVSVNTEVLVAIDWATVSTGADKDNAYMIYNKDQLDLLAHRVNGTHGETCQTDGYIGKYFKLGKDIKYTHTTDWDDFDSHESNFEAIGGRYDGKYRYFRGHFDGNNNTISGIRIYKNGDGNVNSHQGIFGATYRGADIHDLTLADARITGYIYTGGIVGSNTGGTVTRCHVAGDVAVCAVLSGAYSHGGIAGFNDGGGTIRQCTSAATLTTADAAKSMYYGGIAGYNLSTLCYNLAIGATVPALSDNSYGAITGENYGTLQRNYYAACNVADTENATGVGCNNADVTADNGAVSIHTLTLADGITTTTAATVTIGTTGYYAQGTAIALSYSGTIGDGYQLAIVRNDGNGFTAAVADGDGNYTAVMPAANATATDHAPIDWATVSTGADKDNAYMIYNKDQLDLLAYRVNGTHGETRQTDGYENKFFQLAKDISYPHKADGEEGADAENNYEAIGGYYDGNRYFCGNFDGNNKTISGIRIYKDGDGDADRYQGIFGRTNGADIHHLTLADARITGYDYTGGIVGSNNGTVSGCHVADDVAVCAVQSDAWSYGGIVGYNSGTIEQCTSAATLTTADATQSKYYGGIAGYNRSRGTLSDNLAIGATVPAAKGNTYGAITGYNNDGSLLRNYYAACKVADTEYATGVGCGYIGNGNGGYTTADVTANNGAVSIHTLTLADGITTTTPVTVTIGTTGYYAQGTAIALSYSGDVPLGYQYDGFTASAGTLSGSTLTMPAADVTVSLALRSTGELVEVSYVDAGGTTLTHDAIALDGHEAVDDYGKVNLDAGWYFVGTDIAFNHTLYLYGNVHLILADGCTMNVTSSNGNGIVVNDGVSLTIYGQTDGTGTLNATGHFAGIYTDGGNLTISGGRVTATSSNGDGIYIGNSSGNLTISGGRVTATSDNGYGINTDSGNLTISGGRVTATSDNDYGIYSDSGTITISGGRVTATGGAGIFTDSGTITLGCTTDTDFIYVSSYDVGDGGRLNIADGQTLFDEYGNYYSGTII